MRICHVITKPELGGAQLSTLNILSNLSKHRYDVSIVTSPYGILRNEFKNLERVKSYFSPFLARAINPILDILAFIHIYSIYRSNKYHVVHTHSSKAGIIGRWAARLAGVPIIIHTVHGWSFNDYQPPFIKKLFIFLEYLTAKFTTRLICVSKKDLKTGLEYKIAPGQKFVFIKYGIEIAKFRASSTDVSQKRKELKITNNGPIIGMISCLKPQKSPLDYIKACIEVYEKMPGVNFLLIGDGVLRKRCERFLAHSSLNGRFIFTGWRKDVSEILDILDIVVLTSKWEGAPISLIEALCKGRVVIATNVGGIPELVEDGITGYIVRAGDYKQLAERLLKILKDKSLYNKIKTQAFLSIDDSFDLGRMVSQIEGLYGRDL